jgi:type II secretory pathway component PulJ
MNRTLSNRRRAFSIWEMLVALALLVFVLDAAGHLFRSVILLSSDSQKISSQGSQVDSAISQMRRDVWSANDIGVSDSRVVTLDKIAWRLDSDGTVERSDANGRIEQWPQIGAKWKFASDGPVLTISDETSKDLLAVRLVSQTMLSRQSR